jgi:hypothetical protein
MADTAQDEQQAYRTMQREADRICSLIVASDYPAIDVVIEAGKLREFAEQHFAGCAELFEMVYGSRFRRLWRQFRPGESADLLG